jgi:endonuclease YncB( thermonuclease family)
LVLNGYAREYRFYANDYARRPGYTIAQNTAKIFRRGLWNLRTCSMNR